MQKAVNTCKKYGIDAIVAIGGDGTFRGATDLTLHGVPTIGVPGTIDNDVTATDYTIGFDTAMNTVVSLADQFRDTCESHARINVIEVMGRNCGQIALMAGIASGAVAIAIPERPFDEAAVIEKIKAKKAEGRRGLLIIVSEGVFEEVDGKKVPYGEVLRDRIEEAVKGEVRFARLAHVVRGGDPTLRDRLTASRMGVKAVELLLEGKSNLVVLEDDGNIVSMDIVFALTTDRMYKNKLKDGDLDKYSAEELDAMKAICAKREAEITELYKIANEIA
jgi:6-phosphofructokinase 1